MLAWIILLLAMTLPSVVSAEEGPDPIDRVFEMVYQIKTAADAQASKASYGSGFVVDEGGLVATNFHVVAHALHEPEKYKIFLVDGKESLQAEVIQVNAVNDLAIVRVPRTFPRRVAFARQIPKVGEKIYSLGLPEDLNKSVIEGNFNGIVTEGPYEKIQMSIPLNSGMSGGPTVNQAGEVIGVNVAVLLFAQNLAFAVPLAQLKETMQRPPVTFEKKGIENSLDREIEAQLFAVQARLTTELSAAHTAKRLKLPGFTVGGAPEFLKCWRTTEDGTKDKWLVTAEECSLDNAAMITDERYGGTLRVRHEVLENKKLNAWQFANLVGRHSFGDSYGGYDEKLTTRYDCDERDLVNAHGVALKVRYCLNTFVKMAGLYDLDFIALSTAKGKRALVVSGYYSAFARESLTAIFGRVLDGIEANP